jgi:hypothetical protein
MKICLFTSGYVRTLFHGFHKNLEVIMKCIPDCELDICYSFWDKNDRSDMINDAWHYKVNEIYDDISEERIKKYFLDIGFLNVMGEIENFSISENIMNTSPFPETKKRLSSQYWKIYTVAKKYFDDRYDFYLTIRPDVIIQKFLTESDILELNQNKAIVVNENYWYNALYKGMDCNEYVWGSTKHTFINSNNQFLYLNSLINEVHDYYGEIITGKHFNNMLNLENISEIKTFDFDYLVAR